MMFSNTKKMKFAHENAPKVENISGVDLKKKHFKSHGNELTNGHHKERVTYFLPTLHYTTQENPKYQLKWHI